MTLPLQSEEDEIKGDLPARVDVISNDSFTTPRK